MSEANKKSEEKLQAYEEALNTVEALYPAPRVLAKAQQLLRNPTVEIDDLVEVLKSDPSLTTDVIRISNGAYYGYETKTSNLHDAIHRVGFGEIVRLVGLMISKALLSKELSHYKIPHEDYWANSVSVALIMEYLAQRHMQSGDDAYTVGLLHSVGRIVINQLMDDFKLDTTWNGIKPIDAWERDEVGFTSAYAGAMILKRWDFSTKMTHPILYQLNSPKAEMGWGLHSYLYFANRLIAKTGTDLAGVEFEIDEQMHSLLQMLSMQEKDLHVMLEKLQEKFLSIQMNL